MQRTFNFSCVILAAGESKRMGLNKLLLPFRGKRIIEQVAALFEFPEIRDRIIVTGNSVDSLKEIPALSSWRFINNPKPEEGMGQSIKLGLGKVFPATHGIFIAHGDMPLIQKETIAQLICAFTPGCIMLPRYREQRGHPVLIDKSFAQQCLWLEHERPLREIIYQNETSIKYVEVLDAGILTDIDTPEDYEKLKKE